MTIKDVLTIAESRGVKLRVEGNDLVFRAPKGALTPELRQAIVDHKAISPLGASIVLHVG